MSILHLITPLWTVWVIVHHGSNSPTVSIYVVRCTTDVVRCFTDISQWGAVVISCHTFQANHLCIQGSIYLAIQANYSSILFQDTLVLWLCRYLKIKFSFYKLILKNIQMTTLHTNWSLYITFTMIYYIG